MAEQSKQVQFPNAATNLIYLYFRLQVSSVFIDDLVDPRLDSGHPEQWKVSSLCDPYRPVLPGVHAWVVALAAPDAPAHDADLSPVGAGADGHGAARVTLG